MNKLSFFLLTLPLSQLDTDRNLNTIICYLHAYTATTTTMIPSSNSSAPQVKSRQCSSHPRHHSHHSRIRKLPGQWPVFPFRWTVGTRHRTWRRIKPSMHASTHCFQVRWVHSRCRNSPFTLWWNGWDTFFQRGGWVGSRRGTYHGGAGVGERSCWIQGMYHKWIRI